MFTYEQHTFAGGQLDRDLMGRQDLEKYFSGATTLKNFSVRRQGCISKRRGTDVVCDVSALVADGVRLVAFEFERSGGYYLLFTGLVGDESEDSNYDGWNCVYVLDDSGVLTRNFGNSRIAVPGDVQRVRVPYKVEDFNSLSFCQSGDVLFITHENYAPAKISRSLGGLFEFSYCDFNAAASVNPPASLTVQGNGFTVYTEKDLKNGAHPTREIKYAATYIENGLESAMCPAVSFEFYMPWNQNASCNITVTDNEIRGAGGKYNIYKKTLSDWGLIGTTAAGEKTFRDENTTPSLTSTPPKIADRFKEEGGFPSVASIHSQRMCYASSKDEPFKFWMSRVGDLYDFNTHESIREDDAIEAAIAATRFPRINHMVSGRDLVVFCDNGEWIIQPVSGNALTYKTVSTKMQSAIGCSRELPPLQVLDELVFAERNRETLRSIKYQFAQDGYQSKDLSVISADILRANPIRSMAYQQHPDSQIWCVLDDGTIAVLTYMPEQEVVAWARVEIGGGWKVLNVVTNNAVTGSSTSLALLAVRANPCADGEQYCILNVRRDVDSTLGSTEQKVEDAMCLDTAIVSHAWAAADYAAHYCASRIFMADTGIEVSKEDIAGNFEFELMTGENARIAMEEWEEESGGFTRLVIDSRTGLTVSRNDIKVTEWEEEGALYKANGVRSKMRKRPWQTCFDTVAEKVVTLEELHVPGDDAENVAKYRFGYMDYPRYYVTNASQGQYRTDGKIRLPMVVMGDAFEAEFESVYPEAKGAASLQFERKNAKSIDLRIERGSDFVCVPTGVDAARYASYCHLPYSVSDGVVALSRKDCHVPLTGNNTGDGRVRVLSEDVFPLTILSIGINYETQPLNNAEG